jgi:hypothetical protein
MNRERTAERIPKFDAGKACLDERQESDRDTAASSVDSEEDFHDGQYVDSQSGLILRKPRDGNVTIYGTTRKVHATPRDLQEHTLMIWDWDDTLLPSTWINTKGMRLDDDEPPSPEIRRQLAAVAADIERTLRLALTLGTVVVVTNAETGWVDLSCRKFFPSLVSLVTTLRVISARSTYEQPGVFSPLDWKVKAFMEEINAFCPSKRDVVNVMSFGDSVHEREALIRSCDQLQMDSRRMKSVKFPERPEAMALQGTHSVLRKFLQSIVEHDGDLDLAASAVTRLTFFPARV